MAELLLEVLGSAWRTLDRLGLPMALMGGLAVAVWKHVRATRDERAKLQREVNAIQQQAESNWATERMENALLRERINDIAAEVANLAMRIEGPNSSIEAILAQAPAKEGRGQNGASGSEAGGTLADRIRALQAQASKARQPGA